MTTIANITTLSVLVDQLGALKSQIANLTAQEDAIKKQLAASGLSEVDGVLFRSTISVVEPANKVDWKAVAEKLNPSHQLVTAHTTKPASYTTVRVVARKA